MKIIYLDQNVASYLAKESPEPIWKQIKIALVEGFQCRKLVCPLPFETIIETAPLPLTRRQSIQQLFWQLSEGVGFKSFVQMSNELTLALVRPNEDVLPWIIWKPVWAEMEKESSQVASDWRKGKDAMRQRMQAFVRSSNLESMSVNQLLHAVAAQRSGWLLRDLSRLSSGIESESPLNFPFLIEHLIAQRVSPAEIEAFHRAVQHHAWAKIPIHFFDAFLGARWEHDMIRGGAAAYHPNNEIDSKRASLALSYADLFITEGDLANRCLRSKVSDFSHTQVFSIREPDKVLKTVQAIVSSS